MNNFLLSLYNLPYRLLQSLFLPTITTYEQLYIVSPNYAALDAFTQKLPVSENVQYGLNAKVVINDYAFELENDSIAFVMVRSRWWRRTPKISIAVFAVAETLANEQNSAQGDTSSGDENT